MSEAKTPKEPVDILDVIKEIRASLLLENASVGTRLLFDVYNTPGCLCNAIDKENYLRTLWKDIYLPKNDGSVSLLDHADATSMRH